MGKNKEMLNIFLSSIKGDKKSISLITPNSYRKNIYEIDYKFLKKQGYKHLIFDIDNTIMPVNDINVSNELKEFFNKLKKDFTICVVSNNNEARVNPIKKELDVIGLADAKKPKKEAYDKSLKLLNGTKKDTVMIGDQMLSDIVGGNRYGLYTILVEPFENKYDIKTGTSRVLQNILMNRLKEKIERYKYY